MIKKTISSLILCVSLFCLISSNATAENTFTQRSLLLSHQFTALEANLAKANDDYLNNRISIDEYDAVAQTFWLERDIADPALFNALNKWLETNPESAYANVLMGIYWADRAYQARGEKWAAETSQQQFDGMDSFFKKSWPYLKKGLRMDPSILQAYVSMLFITQTASQFGSPQQFMQKEVPADMKHNIEIWETFLQTIVPRWGGSYQQMNHVIKEEIPIFLPKLSDKDLQMLHDVETYDRVDTLIRSKDYEITLKLAEKSINAGSTYTGIYTRAATAAHKLKDVQKCLAYTLKATQLRPWKAKAWNKRGQCAIDRQLWQQANEAYRHKVFIDGITKYGLFKLGQTYMYLYQFDKAYAVFKKAVELDPTYTEYTDMYTSYIEKEKSDQMGLEGMDVYLIIGEP